MTIWTPHTWPDPHTEPRRVTLTRGEWIDPARQNRIVPYKLYVPDALPGDALFPVIIWSHGLGGGRDGAGFIARYIASHGYILVHVQHPGTDTSLWEGKPGHPWTHIRAAKIPRKIVLARYQDIPFVLRMLHDNPPPHADLTRLGMSGHSFGALTTQIMAGQYLGRPDRFYHLRAPAFRAGVLYSPVPGRSMPTHPGFSYSGIQLPLLHFTGTDDQSPVSDFAYDRRLDLYAHITHPDQHLIVLKDGDHMVFNGSRGGLSDNPARARHEEIIKLTSLAWWEGWLRDDKAARNWLMGAGAQNFIGADATYEFK